MYRPFFSQTQSGSSLIEVMVALLVLGIGLLGVVSLQSKGLNSNQQAVFVTEAQLLAQDMADRIMAFGPGSQGDNTGDYAGIDTDNVLVQANGDPLQVDCSPPTGCDATQTRQYDQLEWDQLVEASSLPRGRGVVTWVEPVYRIQIIWDQGRTGEGEVVCDSESPNISCYEMELRLP